MDDKELGLIVEQQQQQEDSSHVVQNYLCSIIYQELNYLPLKDLHINTTDPHPSPIQQDMVIHMNCLKKKD